MTKHNVPKISIIMPVYNGANWLNNSIPSVLKHTNCPRDCAIPKFKLGPGPEFLL